MVTRSLRSERYGDITFHAGLAGLQDACNIVAHTMAPTPQYCWPRLNRRIGCEVWVKHENHTPVGSFKVRGGVVLIDELHRAGRLPRRMVTATRGNQGQSIPFAARRYGFPVTVLAPKGNSVEKNEAMVGWGADLVEFGEDFEEARLEARSPRRGRGRVRGAGVPSRPGPRCGDLRSSARWRTSIRCTYRSAWDRASAASSAPAIC